MGEKRGKRGRVRGSYSANGELVLPQSTTVVWQVLSLPKATHLQHRCESVIVVVGRERANEKVRQVERPMGYIFWFFPVDCVFTSPFAHVIVLVPSHAGAGAHH